eukprot:g3415.t1
MDVIDTFLATFTVYIDSGFGLLAGDVAYLTTTLIAIDITLAGLFWALSQGTDVIAGLIKKVLYVGFFAFIIGNFSLLTNIVFDSFAQLGLTAGGGAMTAPDLLRPGFIASVGFDAAGPLLSEISDMLGPISFFHNFIMIAIMFVAWAVIIIAFFVLAIQLFITILEFKLTTLAGFILVPFALWNKTSFLAERVLGNVITSGVKLMVLAVIIGIGSTLFATVTAAFQTGDDVTLAGVMGTGVAKAGGYAARRFAARPFRSVQSAYQSGSRAAWTATGGAGGPENSNRPPENWARRLQAEQRVGQAGSMAIHSIRDGDRGSGGASPQLNDKDN